MQSGDQSSVSFSSNIEGVNTDQISIPFSRSAAERIVLMELMAMRDESNLRRIDPKDREKFTDEAIGKIMQLDTQEIVAQASAIRPTGSFSNGVGCGGTPNFSNGVTCKLVLRR